MHYRILVLIAAFLLQIFVIPRSSLAAPVTANPNASADAQKVLAYLTSLPTRPDHRVISGQFIGMIEGASAVLPYGNASYGYSNYVEKLAAQSGQWVGMIGMNYGRIRQCLQDNPIAPGQKSPFMACDGSRPDY